MPPRGGERGVKLRGFAAARVERADESGQHARAVGREVEIRRIHRPAAARLRVLRRPQFRPRRLLL